jgi:hypothetical protein
MRRLVPGVIALAGYVLVLVGVVVFNLAGVVDQPPYDFGWSAYAPLEETRSAYQSALTYASVDGGTVLWTGGHLIGAGLAVLGGLVLAGVGAGCSGTARACGGAPAADLSVSCARRVAVGDLREPKIGHPERVRTPSPLTCADHAWSP